MPQAIRARRPYTVEREAGPLIGVRELTRPVRGLWDRRYATRGRDLTPERRDVGGFLQRPGYAVMGGASDKNIGGSNPVQRQFTWLLEDGTRRTFAWADGSVWEATWSGTVPFPVTAWTEVLAPSDFSGAGITVSLTARIYVVAFSAAGVLVVSDGVNTPWSWDGTTNGGLTLLSDCPVLYGQPTIHEARLFGILNSNRRSFVYSEVADPTTGYVTGFNNIWDLRQTDAAPLVAIRGTNEGLYAWRTHSTTFVPGAVDADWQSAATLEAVSQTIGAAGPDAVDVWERTIVFLDQDRRPRVLAIGSGLLDFPHEDAAVTTRFVQDADLSSSTIDPLNRLGLIGVRLDGFSPTPSGTGKNAILVMDLERMTWLGWWTVHRQFETLDTLFDSRGASRVCLAGTAGYAFSQGTTYENDSVQNLDTDEDGNQTTVDMIVTSPFFGAELPGLVEADLIDVAGQFPDAPTVFLSYVPEGAVVNSSSLGGAAGPNDGRYIVGVGPILAHQFCATVRCNTLNTSTVRHAIRSIRTVMRVVPDDARVLI